MGVITSCSFQHVYAVHLRKDMPHGGPQVMEPVWKIHDCFITLED